MPKIIVKNDDGSCGQASLRPYPTVVAGDNVTVTPTTAADGSRSFTVEAADTDVNAYVECEGVIVTVESSTGDNTDVTLACAECWPIAQLQTVGPNATNYTTPSGAITASTLVRSTKVYGGFELVDATGATTTVIDGTSVDTAVGVRVPKNGVYEILFRGQTLKTTGTSDAAFIRVDLINATQGGVAGGAGLKHLGLDHALFDAAPLINSRTRVAELQAGDILQFDVRDDANQFNFIGAEASIKFVSNIPGEHGCPN